MEILNEKKTKFLEMMANQLRQDVVETLLITGSGHSASPLGIADVFSAFYFHILNHKPKKTNWPERDRFVLSCGHYCPIQYAAMARAGYFPLEELKTLRKINTRLQGHPHRTALPGIEVTSGPLGDGLPQAVGMALSARMNKEKHRIYCLTSDGEHNTGIMWEAIMFAGKNKLSNLTVILDRNNIQIDGFTEDVMPLDSLKEKYESFNWHVLEIDGHNIEAIIDAVNEANVIFEKPTVIIAHTIPGKGVSFMERDFVWHGIPPNKEQAKKALHELRTLGGKIRSEHE